MKESPTNTHEMIEWLEMIRDYGMTIDGEVDDNKYIAAIIKTLQDYDKLKRAEKKATDNVIEK